MLTNWKDSKLIKREGEILSRIFGDKMDITQINQLISDLENVEPSMSNIRNLSALYTVRTNLSKVSVDTVTEELHDILPSYVDYISTKRKYQMHETSLEKVESDIQRLCKEIKEFLLILYRNTDTAEERECIIQMLKSIFENF